MTELEEFLAGEIDQGSFPGAAALVGDAEAVTETAVAGHAVVDPERVPVAADTIFDFASQQPLEKVEVARGAFIQYLLVLPKVQILRGNLDEAKRFFNWLIFACMRPWFSR